MFTPAVTLGSTAPAAGRVTGPPRSPACSVVLVNGPAALAEHAAAWEELAAAALEPNAFYEPWMLVPAVRAFGAGVDLRFVLVYAAGPTPVLCGFFPMERRRRYRGLPLPSYRLWQHKHCFLGTPLLRASHARQALAAWFDWLANGPQSCPLLEMPLVPAEGAFAGLLAELCMQRGRRMLITDRQARGLLVPHADADAYLQTAMSGSSRRALKRRQKRLAETGRLTCEAAKPGTDATAWIEDFLQLEASGWKGTMGTALAASAPEAGFFRTVTAEAACRGRLLTLALRLDGRAIGCRCAFLAGDGAFAFKSAYDEAFAAFSPGMMLELENIRQCHALPALRWMDSCTSPDNDMINRLFLDRRTLQTVTVSTGHPSGSFAITMLHLLQRLRRRCRGG